MVPSACSPILVDVFCGAGALSYGFLKERFEVVAGVDLDATCRFAYEANIRGAQFHHADLALMSNKELAALLPRSTRPRVLAGCAPCQPFSIYTTRSDEDGRWRLLRDFRRAVTAMSPDVVTMENVLRIVNHPVFHEFCRELESDGYHVTHYVAKAHLYGTPQRRSRLVLFASRLGPIQMLAPPLTPARARTVRDAIGALPPIEAGEAHRSDHLHRARGLTPKNLARIKSTPPGGSWSDWSDDLLLDCHKRDEGKSFRSVYGRMEWDQPSPVITTQCLGIGNGRFGHPDQDRAISIREAALLQGFPRGYKFVRAGEPVNGQALARQIGNAVPIPLARAVARSIGGHLRDHSGLKM